METERVTFFTTPDHKPALDAFAVNRGMSVGHVVREATSKFISQPTQEEEAGLAALVEQVNEAVPKMHASIESMIATMDAAHKRVDMFLRDAGIRK